MKNQNKAGLAFGTLVGLAHVLWSILIAFGWAVPFLNFVFWMHSVKNPLVFLPFSFGKSIVLIAITFCVGYVIGYVFSTIWNKFHK